MLAIPNHVIAVCAKIEDGNSLLSKSKHSQRYNQCGNLFKKD
ncbi:hypothetical protein ACERJO_20235 [Halalkalibacter sp. AB-rgal2]